MIGDRWNAWVAGHHAGRDDYPDLLAELYYPGNYGRADDGFSDDLDELAHALADAWQMPDHPSLGALQPLDWAHMFQRVGYVIDGRRAEAERPHEPLTLYRGAHPRFRRGMSWTDRLDIASWFTGYRSPGGSRVYVAKVPPDALLARLDGEGGRRESEFVVDMRGVRTATVPIGPDSITEHAARYAEEIQQHNAVTIHGPQTPGAD